MKNISKIIGIGALAMMSLTSCERDITSLNQDPKHPSSLPSENFLASHLFYSAYHMYSPHVSSNNYRFFVQQLATTNYLNEPRYDLVTRDQPRRHFNAMYVNSINPLKFAKKSLATEANATQAIADNKWAVLELAEIFVWENLVNTYGNIPYTEAFDVDNNLSPKYDDAMSIYTDLLKRIDNAIAKITANAQGYGASDVMYYGDMSKWIKFANSLKLRLAMNLADVNPTLSKSIVETAITAGVMTSNSDSYSFAFDTGAFKSPVYETFVASGRTDFIPSSVVINMMNTKSDPRRAIWFTTTTSGEYKGGVYGSRNTYRNFSHYSSTLTAANAPANLLSYTEVLFLRAEAAARGYNAGDTAENLYNAAIRESMTSAGVGSSEITSYLAANPYNSSNWKKSIGEEVYIALFDRAYAAWNFTRRLDFPVLTNPGGSNLSSIPYRMPYSSWEYTRNGANVKAAAAAMGGDKAETKLFWDIH